MSDKFQDRYRIPSARAHWWNYRKRAAYFVTICTYNHECLFGEIYDGVMHLSGIGAIADNYFSAIPKHFPFVQLDKFIVMPNHVHAIICISGTHVQRTNHVETLHATSLPPTTSLPATTFQLPAIPLQSMQTYDSKHVDKLPELTQEGLLNIGSETLQETLHATSLHGMHPIPSPIKNKQMSSISPKCGSLGTIIRSYKSAVSKTAHLINPNFEWQARFHDHIIRDKQEYLKISAYIQTNVSKWEEDKLYRRDYCLNPNFNSFLKFVNH